MAQTTASALLGRIAITYKLITPEQLNEATRVQGRFDNKQRLGEILLGLGYITPEQLEWLLRAQEQVMVKQRPGGTVRPEAGSQTPVSAQPSPTPQPVRAARPAPAPDPAPAPAPVRTAPPSPSPPVVRPAPVARPAPAGLATPLPVAPAPTPAPPMTPEPAPVARVRTATPVVMPAPTPPEPAAAPAPVAVAPVTSSPAREVDSMLALAARLGASDVHLHTGVPVQFRIAGQLVLQPRTLSAADAERIILAILEPAERERFAESGDIDLAYVLPGVARFRVNIYRQQRGLDAVFRLIPLEPPTLDALGLPSMLARLTTYHQGLVLVTGPAGCGKSSTLAALVNLINEERKDHIITVDDPIEFVHRSKGCVVNQRQIVRHTESFAAALRAALREDPDVIAIGELRDLETVSLAITAAETGHLVLATLHTNNSIRTINRILDVFPPSQQSQIRSMLSESLRAVVSQRLVPTLDGTRRVAALELLLVTTAVSNLIREDKTFQIATILTTNRSQGMCRVDDSLADLVRNNIISRDVARRFADDPRPFA